MNLRWVFSDPVTVEDGAEELGYYELECEWCLEAIHGSWRYVWCKDYGGPPYGFYGLHWGACMAEFLEENDDKVWRHKGSPHFKLDIPYTGDEIQLGRRHESQNLARLL